MDEGHQSSKPDASSADGMHQGDVVSRGGGPKAMSLGNTGLEVSAAGFKGDIKIIIF